jgi:predicted small secreted protein
MKHRIRKLAVIALPLAIAVLTVACNNGSGSGY